MHEQTMSDEIYLAESLPVPETIEVDNPQTVPRLIIEALFYVVTLITTFPNFMGLSQITFALGGSVMFVGFLALLLMLSDRQEFMISIRFVLVIVIGVNISQFIVSGVMPFIGTGSKNFSHWIANLITVCFLVQNTGARKRLLLFYATLVILVVFRGGAMAFAAGTEAIRLDLKEQAFATVFSNSNALSYISGMLAVSCLFWSLRAKKIIRPVLWLAAILLAVILFRAASRGGVIIFLFGIMMIGVVIMFNRGTRMGGIVMIILAFVLIAQFGYILASHFELIGERMGQRSSRADVYDIRTLGQMGETLLLGQGPGTKIRHVGILSHNSFISMHLYYGGITAWVYLTWLIVLAIRIYRMMRSKDYLFDTRMFVFTLFMMCIFTQILSNQGYMAFTVVYPIAIVEVYTSAYSRRKINERYRSHSYIEQEEHQESLEGQGVNAPVDYYDL